MAAILRGEIVWVELDPVVGHEQGGRRPVLVISQDELNRTSGTVIGLSITSQEPQAGYPLTYELRSGGLNRRSWVKMSQVRTLSTQRIRGRASAVDPDELVEIVEGLIELVT